MNAEWFGPYELVRLIGRGGMGEVFEAHDTEQDRTVALKRLVPHLATDQEFQKRFRRESRLAARLSSPHVIPIHRSGEIDGQLFIDMRMVYGCDLEQLLLAESTLAPARAVRIVEQVASALDAAHHAGLIHRDIKPSNVLLDTAVGADEFVYLADFGITRAIGGESQSLTSTHAVVGSLDYMAPEQFDGVAGPQIDVYSLGCLLFQCLTGSKPFPVEGFPQLMRAHLSKPAPRPSELRPEIGEGLDAVVTRALAKDPEQRFPSAGTLAAAARAAVDGRPAPGRPGRTDLPAEEQRTPVTVGAGRSDDGAGVLAAAGSLTVATPRGAGAVPATPTAEPPPTTALAAGAGSAAPPSGPARPPEAAPPPPPGPPPAYPPGTGPHGGTGGGGAPWTRGSSRALLWVGGALGLVVVLVLGVVIGTSVTSGGAPGVDGGGVAIPLAPAAPALRSSDTPTAAATLSVGNAPEAIALSVDGRRAYVTGTGGGNVVNVVDTTNGNLLATIPAPGPPQFIAMEPSGARAYVTLYDPARAQNAVAVLDVGAGAFTAVIPTGQKRPFGLAVSPDGSRVYVPNHDSGDVTVIDTSRQAVVAQIPVPESPHWIAFSPTGRIAYAANHHSGVVTVLDTRTNAVTAVIPIGDMVAPHSIAVMPDGRRAQVTNYEGNTVSTIDTATNQVIATVPVGRNPQSIAFARDGRHSYVVNNATNDMSVINTETGAVTATVPLGTSPWMVAVSPDGRFAYVTNKETNALTVVTIAG